MARIEAPEKPGPLTRLVWRIAKRQTSGKLAEPVALMAHSPLLMNLRARFNWALGIESQGYADGAVCVRPEKLPERNGAIARS